MSILTLTGSHSTRRRFVLISLILVLVIFFVSFVVVYVFFNDGGDEFVLRTAVDDAEGPTVIAISGDIKLTRPLVISSNKNITLTSDSTKGEYFKLIGANYANTIVVADGGVLIIDTRLTKEAF